jgi:hypothetical protein
MRWYRLNESVSGSEQVEGFVNAVMNFGFHKMLGSSLVAASRVGAQLHTVR